MKRVRLLIFVVAMILVMAACNDDITMVGEKWEENSPDFITEYGEMFGKKGSIGIIGSKSITENGQKWMWHFWGSEKISDKEWEVKAYKQGKKAINPITFKDPLLTARDDEITGHGRSAVLFPESGRWKLNVYIDGEFFDEIIVDISQA